MLKRLIATSCVLCLLLTTIPYIVSADDALLSRGKSVNITFPEGKPNPNYRTPENFTNGNFADTKPGYAILSTDDWRGLTEYQVSVVIDLESTYYINQVDLYPVVTVIGGVFPVQFRIDVSKTEDFATYETIHNQNTDLYTPSTPATVPHVFEGPATVQSYDTSERNTFVGRYIRIFITKCARSYNAANDTKGYPRVAFNEIEVFGEPASDYPVYHLLSSGKNVVKSGGSSGNGDTTLFTDSNITTPDTVNCGETNWASQTQFKPQFTMELGGRYTVYEVKLHPILSMFGSSFPLQFSIEISDDPNFSTYTTLYTTGDENYFPFSEEAPHTAQGPQDVESFKNAEGISGRYVRINGAKNAAYWNDASGTQGFRRVGFTEIEVIGHKKLEIKNTYTPAEVDGAISLTVDTEIIKSNADTAVGTLIYALFSDEGRLCEDVKIVRDITINPGSNTGDNLKALFEDLDSTKIYLIKVMLWKDYDGTFIPMCDNTVWPSE